MGPSLLLLSAKSHGSNKGDIDRQEKETDMGDNNKILLPPPPPLSLSGQRKIWLLHAVSVSCLSLEREKGIFTKLWWPESLLVVNGTGIKKIQI